MKILFDKLMRTTLPIPNELLLVPNSLIVFGNKVTKNNKEYFKYTSSILFENDFLKLNISKNIFQHSEYYFSVLSIETQLEHLKSLKKLYDNPFTLEILLFQSEHNY